MRRSATQALFTLATLTVGVVLLLAGGLLTWGSSTLSADAETQLRNQRIVFPPAGPALADPNIGPFIEKYAGQPLTTGEQAKAYADHYVAVKLVETTGGRTYAELAAASQVNPADAQLADLAETAFRAETLRGALLEAHSDAKLSRIAGYGAWSAFAGALTMLLLSAIGFRNLTHGRAPRAIPAARNAAPLPTKV